MKITFFYKSSEHSFEDPLQWNVEIPMSQYKQFLEAKEDYYDSYSDLNFYYDFHETFEDQPWAYRELRKLNCLVLYEHFEEWFMNSIKPYIEEKDTANLKQLFIRSLSEDENLPFLGCRIYDEDYVDEDMLLLFKEKGVIVNILYYLSAPSDIYSEEREWNFIMTYEQFKRYKDFQKQHNYVRFCFDDFKEAVPDFYSESMDILVKEETISFQQYETPEDWGITQNIKNKDWKITDNIDIEITLMTIGSDSSYFAHSYYSENK